MSAADVVRAHLARIEQTSPSLNAFVDVRAEAAIAEAVAQDEAAARGVPRGPLGGLPITIKSAIEVAGLRCETGSPTRKGRIARRDAVIVERLRRAGAIVLGTTNVAEMLMGYETDNPLHGRTSNPWDLTRTPGGSSGGESAAIAAGCSAAGVGSDGGGSIRVPAHFTGICGLKPTPGRWPSTGHQPACLGPFSLIAAVGPMARTIGDLEVLDRVASGWDAGDPMSVADAETKRPATGATQDGLRVAFFEDDGLVPVTADTRAAVRRAAAALADAGFTVEELYPPALAGAARVWEVLFAECGLIALHDELGGAERDLPILRAYLQQSICASASSAATSASLSAPSAATSAFLSASSAALSAPSAAAAPLSASSVALSAAQLIDAWAARDRLRAEFQAQLGARRVLICPVAATPAFLHGERAWEVESRRVTYLESMRYAQWFNVLGVPAAVVPVAQSSDGLPIGVQVVGLPFDDDRVLEVAALIERQCGGYRPPPGA